jgi:hypothetical protein
VPKSVSSAGSYTIGVSRGGLYFLTPLVHIAHGRGWHELQTFVDVIFRKAGPRDQMSILTAYNIDNFVGLNMVLCKQWTNDPVLRSSYTLFAMGLGI